jgi:hypothetical protein
MFYRQTNQNRNDALRGRRRGAFAYIVAAAFIVILGFSAFAVDYSVLVSDANRLQRACDAAALAGAAQLKATGNNATDTANAKARAVLVAGQNKVTVDPANITFNSDFTEITVPAVYTQPLYFARVLSIGSKTLTRQATARAVAGRSTPDLAPIGITQATYDLYAPNGVPAAGTGNRAEILFIDHKKQAFGTNDFILFDLRSVENNAKSATHMVSQLEGTEKVQVNIGTETNGVDVDFLDALNAASSGAKFLGGMRTRFQAAAGSPWFDAPASPPSDYLNYVGQHYDQVFSGSEPTSSSGTFRRNPRVMDLIITTPMTAKGGNTNSPVLDFAPVYVESVSSVTGGVKMVVRFLPKNLSSGGGSGVALIR